MKITLQQTSNTLGEALAKVEKLNNESVSVGHFAESGEHSSGMSYPELMKLHHTGVPSQGIPARPVLTILFQNNLHLINQPVVQKAIKAYMKSDLSEKAQAKMLRAIGRHLAQKEVELFGSTPPLTENAQSTRDMKGFDAPLVETGELMEATSYKDSVTKRRTKWRGA